MEKSSDDLGNFLVLPIEIQQEIAAYLNVRALGFFARSNKQIFMNVLPLLAKHEAMLSWRLSAKGKSTYIYQANQLFVCGKNNYGQLGLRRDYCDTFKAVSWREECGLIRQVIAGANHAVVLTQDNRLWVSGGNRYGQLGLRNYDYEYCYGFAAVPWLKDQGEIKQVSAGESHTIVLTKDNRLWVCGKNDYGQLGLGDNENRFNFNVIVWPKDRRDIQQVIAGGNHTIVLTRDKKLWVCGANEHGQLGLGDNENRSTFTAVPWLNKQGRIEQVVAGWKHTIVSTHWADQNRLWVCGANEDSQLGLGDNKNRSAFTLVERLRCKIKQIVAGLGHTIVLTKDNKVWGCGNNCFNQLGLEQRSSHYPFTAMSWPEERGRIKQIVAGPEHTLILTHDNELWVCGKNDEGQLGLEDGRARNVPLRSVKELSEAIKQVLNNNNNLKQLVKMKTLYMQTSKNDLETSPNQHQVDEAEEQQQSKMMRL